jgi:hypothetical protein
MNWLVFIAETESVYCAVRAEYLKSMAQGVNRWAFAAAAAWFRCPVSACEISSGKSWHGDSFFSEYFSFPLSLSPH